MKKDLKYYLNLPYKLIVQKDDDYFIAYYREYPKVVGAGDTQIEAINDFNKAFKSLIEECLAANEQIKEPIVEDKKQRVSVLIRQSTLKAIKKISSNRSVFLDKAAAYIIKNKIQLNS